MARRRRRLEQICSMGVAPGGLLELSKAIDEYVSFFVRGVRLFTDAHEQGLIDDVMAERARKLSATMLAQIPTFDTHVAKWENKTLTPESRREVVRLADQLARCRLLGETLLNISPETGPPKRRLRGGRRKPSE